MTRNDITEIFNQFNLNLEERQEINSLLIGFVMLNSRESLTKNVIIEFIEKTLNKKKII